MSKQDPEAISNFLAEQRDEASDDLQHIFLTFEDLWERKLWHQLTDNLLEYFNNPASEKQRLPIYNTFIISFADKVNQLKLVKLALRAAAQISGMSNRHQDRQRVLTRSQMTSNEASSSNPLENELTSPIPKMPTSTPSPNSPACT